MELSPPQNDNRTDRKLSFVTILRAGVILFVTFWAFWGPYYRQVKEGDAEYREYLVRWVMFSNRGAGIRDVNFYIMLPNGTMQELDRREALDYDSLPEYDQEYVWRMMSRDQIRYVANLLCDDLDNDVDIRVVSRRGTVDGWVDEFDGSENMCQ